MHNSYFEYMFRQCFFFLQEGVTHIGPQEQYKEPQIGIINSFLVHVSPSSFLFKLYNQTILNELFHITILQQYCLIAE